MLDITLNSLTYVFSNGTRSPPALSYAVENSQSVTFSAEPSHKYELPVGVALGSLEFG